MQQSRFIKTSLRFQHDLQERVGRRLERQSEISELPTSLRRPAGRTPWTLQKGHYVFGLIPAVGTKRVPHPVAFAIFHSCHTLTNGHRFVGWTGEMMKGKGLLYVYDRMRTCEGWYCLRKLYRRHRKEYMTGIGILDLQTERTCTSYIL